MKVALVHDWLNQKIGGAERVLMDLAELFPDAPIYTLVYDPKRFNNLIDPNRVHVSSLQGWAKLVGSRVRYLLPLIPPAVEGFDLSEYDVVISSSSAFVKNILTKPSTLHICYCHSPARFAWDHWPAYLDEQRVGTLRKMIIRILVSRFRTWDKEGSARVDRFIANSRFTADRISKYYRRDSEVIYPGIDLDKVTLQEKKDFYLLLGVLSPYKKAHLAIEAFNQTGRPLVVVGEGSELPRLKQMARSNITFTGWVDEAQKKNYLAQAKALIYPGEEDFGLIPLEAMACGTGVIAYQGGGALETVKKPGGVFFAQATAASLNKAVEEWEKVSMDPIEIQATVADFSRKSFQKAIKDFVNKAYEEYVGANNIS